MSLLSKQKLEELGLENLDIDQFKPQDAPLQKSGILIVEKPEGISSMDVVRLVRRVCRPKKVGHGGSLDPLATGVLPVLLNSATRWSNDVMGGVKEYEGYFLLGMTSDTQDITGVTQASDQSTMTGLDFDRLKTEAKKFEGEILQTPPLYSAVKKNGRPLYEYARAGEQVEVASRKVQVDRFELTSWDGQSRVGFVARVHKGTYLRTLVHDLGQNLGCGAVLESLSRTQVGPFHLDEAVRLSTIKFSSDVEKHLKPVSRVYNN